MKKFIVMAILAIGFGSFAQQKTVVKTSTEKKSVGQRQEMRLQKMEKELLLTPDQVSKMKTLMADNAEVKKVQLEDKKAQLKNDRAGQKAEIEKILTPEQFKKWESNISERKEKMKERRSKR